MSSTGGPGWVESLFRSICETVEFKGHANLEGFYSDPTETSWGTHLLEINPQPMELSGGSEDGAVVEGIIHAFDVLAVSQMFQRVDGITFGFENDGRVCIAFEGMMELYSGLAAGIACAQENIVILVYDRASR